MKSREKALSQLRKSLRSNDRGEELPIPMKKVSVMADSKEGLEEGLEKAEDILEELPLPEDDMKEELPKMSDMSDEDDSEDESDMSEVLSKIDDMSPEECKMLLMKLKSKMT